MNLSRLLALVSCFALAAPLHAQKPVVPDSEAAQHVGEEVTVTGKLVAVTKSAKGHSFLSFGDRFPRQIFTGVIFSSDEQTVGDVKQYEGKEIAVTGKVELSPDQKPQIVIHKPEQLTVATAATATSTPPAAPAPSMATPATPAPVPVQTVPPPAPTSVGASSVTTPSSKAAAPTPKIALSPNWNSPGQGSEMIRKDLARLFGAQSLPPEKDQPVFVYPDIPYLTPITLAKKLLKLETASSSTGRVTCPGMPVGSFTAHVFAGVFAGGFTHLYLITDNADQLVSVLVTDENVRQRTPDVTDTDGYHTYNFITQRVKGTNDLIVKHALTPEGAPAGTIVIDSTLIDPKDQETPPPIRTSKTTSTKSYTSRTPKTGKVLERSRWYVPVPVVNLILRCVGSR